MLSNYEQFDEKATKIRNSFRDFEKKMNGDITLDEKYKRDSINDAKMKASEEMKTLKKEYKTAKEKEGQAYVDAAFKCQGDTNAYLQAMMTADNMKRDERQHFARNSISISAYDHVRAIARSAYNNGDHSTLKFILENTDVGSVTTPIRNLMDKNINDTDTRGRREVMEWEMFAFRL